MTESENIFVIENNKTNKLKFKGSQFIGFCYKITSSSEAIDYLKNLKKEHYDASHHCYAYKTKDNEEKYSDDGEPNGSAGIRILNSINHFTLTDILVVVVRYFGGTKLGVGPLGKAYGETAVELLSQSNILKLTKFAKISIDYNYDDVSSVHYLLKKYNAQKINNIFTTSPSIECFIEPSSLQKFNDDIVEKTAGNAIFADLDTHLYLRLK